MEIEAGLSPPSIRLDDITRKYALKIKSLPQQRPLWCLLNSRYLEDMIIAKPTQLEIAFAAIQDLWSTNVEEIDYWKTRAWETKSFYKVLISNKSKAEETIAHRHMIESDRGTKTLQIHTDASGVQATKGIEIGMVAFNMLEDKMIYESHANIGCHQVVYNGEIEAIVGALELVSKEVNYRNYIIKIFSDNQAALQKLNNYSEKPGQTQQIRASEAAGQARNNVFHRISLIWVPGHQKIYGNEKADVLATDSTNSPPTSHKISLYFIHQENRQKLLQG